MKVNLTAKKQIAEGTLYVEFATGGEQIDFKPGQFFRLTWTQMLYMDERGNSRFLGFVNIPNGAGVAASVTRMGPSAFKKSLADARLGTEAEIDGVGGKMMLPEETDCELVIVTGGIGIAPIMGLLRWEKEKSLGHKILLIDSNTNRARAIFLEELRGYENSLPKFKLVATMTQDPDWGGETGRIDTQFLKEKISPGNNNIYFVTGTPRFVPDMVKHLRELGVNPSQMKFEIFTGY